jgi:solute carrier family 34 (sodium-dependent phosphate cotransporter)
VSRCPIFFREGATIVEDKLTGGFVFLLAMGIIVLSTMGLIVVIKFLLNGLSVRVVQAVTRCNGYVGILLGGALTVFAQSSQIVISTLVPFAGVGALPLETVYPMVVGSNVGTALQTVLTSLGAFGEAPLQVALAHLFFNVTGLILWYPLPHLRSVPLWAASRMGQCARDWRLFPIVSIVLYYLVVPAAVFGLSELYLTDNGFAMAFVIAVAVVGGASVIWTVYWCWFKGGHDKYIGCISKLSRKRAGSLTFSEHTGSDEITVNQSAGLSSLKGSITSFKGSSTSFKGSSAPERQDEAVDIDLSERYVDSIVLYSEHAREKSLPAYSQIDI